MTAKHKMVKNGIKNSPLLFECICGKTYKYQPGLSRHKQQCIEINKCIDKANTKLCFLIDEQQRHHTEQEKKINELTEKISNMSLVTNNNTTNKFNLNFFLNNECKDAIDFQTFLKQIKIDEEDLYYFGNHGY